MYYEPIFLYYNLQKKLKNKLSNYLNKNSQIYIINTYFFVRMNCNPNETEKYRYTTRNVTKSMGWSSGYYTTNFYNRGPNKDNSDPFNTKYTTEYKIQGSNENNARVPGSSGKWSPLGPGGNGQFCSSCPTSNGNM